MRSPDTQASARAREMERVLGVTLATWVVTAAALLAVGVTPAPGLTLLPILLLLALPFAYGIACGLFPLGRLLRGWRGSVPVLGMALGGAVTWFYRMRSPAFLLACLLLLAIVAVDCRRDPPRLRYLVAGVVALFVGFRTVNNLNYLLARLTFDRVHDPALRTLDLALYRVLVPGVQYEGLFPLTDSALWFQLFEHAYMMVFPEAIVVLAVLYLTGADVRGFFRRLFACYGLGLLVAAIYPAVSPCVYFPESFRAAYDGTMAAALGRGLAADYAALRQGLPLGGFGYFVAIPSMHVAMAVILQASLARSRIHFWTFLPVNVLIVASTVALGQHYLVDVPAGLLVGAIVLAVRRT